ncbi:MAG: ADP-glyceromanno-heptose 6-epimerase [Alphaproteobacteria bacterium]|jgi:ADP-L-glycero-D-manno-heptose 6-epimerase|nr:ADP-glyceromanno-heptose 6-epimerase [Alphaproteobacteria bacterium]MBT4711152.1 ADP-glyceromanno-heptose 6-epimerase [Alphaproteobacteria bacterium]MBT5861167.1 ADP-glyceromanno-heptose 6-epimerase [Alphaproteobacteria bacterium]
MIVVTGGAGFIGSNLVAALEERGETEILVCDRLGSDDRWRNLARRELAHLIKPEQLFDVLDDNADAVDMIFHMGAISDTTATDAEWVMENNFGFSLALWEWSAANNTRLVYASSAATYGDGDNGYDDDASIDALAKLRPLNPYAWSKHLMDRRVARLLESGGIAPAQSVGLKFFNVYGPNEYHKGGQSSVVHHAWSQITDGGSVRLFRSHRDGIDDGHQARDFVHVDDCVAVMLWLMDNPSVSGLFNVGTGKARTFLDLANAVFSAMGVEPNIEFIDTPAAIRDRYQYFTEAPLERLRAAGFDGEFLGLEDGVGRYVGEFLMRQDPYR